MQQLRYSVLKWDGLGHNGLGYDDSDMMTLGGMASDTMTLDGTALADIGSDGNEGGNTTKNRSGLCFKTSKLKTNWLNF